MESFTLFFLLFVTCVAIFILQKVEQIHYNTEIIKWKLEKLNEQSTN